MAPTKIQSREPSFLRSVAFAGATLAILTTLFGGLYLRAEGVTAPAGDAALTASR